MEKNKRCCFIENGKICGAEAKGKLGNTKRKLCVLHVMYIETKKLIRDCAHEIESVRNFVESKRDYNEYMDELNRVRDINISVFESINENLGKKETLNENENVLLWEGWRENQNGN